MVSSVLHDQVDVAVLLVLLVQAYDAWMVQLLENLQFTIEILLIQRRDDLHAVVRLARHDLACRIVHCFSNYREGTLAEILAFDLIVFELVVAFDLMMTPSLRMACCRCNENHELLMTAQAC